MLYSFKFFIIILFMFSLKISSVYADDTVSQSQEESQNSDIENENLIDSENLDDVYIMEDMDVIETFSDGKTPGQTQISREMIDNLPAGNGSITDLLTIVPGVQFSEDYRSTENIGEVKPAKVSISGGNFYDNLFLVDGMSNSSLLDPASDNPNLASDVAGDPQKFFINSWLIEDITIYDSNVSAAYDGFTGGVVDVNTKKPGSKFGGTFSYKGTGDPLTHFFLNESEKDSFDKGLSSKQLKFQKHFLSGALDIPITDRGGLLLSYNRNWSILPKRYFDTWKDEQRTSETYYLKGQYNINSYSYTDATVSYSPHYDVFYIKNTKDSRFTINGGGVFSALNYVNEYDGHKIKVHLDYSWSENSKDAPDDFKSWAITKYKPWGALSTSTDSEISAEGGFGSIDKEEHSVKLNFDHNVKPLEFFGEHKISYGVSYNFVNGMYHRLKDAATYLDVVRSPDVICTNSNDCVDGDQYFTRRNVTPASKVIANVNLFSAYIEELYKIERVSIRAGLRMSYDDYMNNVNFAPRTKLSIDVFNNGYTVLTGGYNRYYSAPLLSYKLREGRAPSYTEKRWTYNNIVQPWEKSSDGSKSTYNYAGLRTPYSDEYVANITQKFFESYLDLKYIERHSKDQIATSRSVLGKDGIAYYSFNNNGSSKYRSVQAKWSKSWKNHQVMANLTWQQSETSNDTYDSTFDLEDMDDYVYYNGKKILAYELPKDNFARPITLNLAYTGLFFDRLRLSLMFKYRSPYTAIQQIDSEGYSYTYVDPDTGETVEKSTSAYSDVEYGHNVNVDLSIEYTQKVWLDHKITISVEIYNLLNLKNEVGTKYYSSTGVDYETGISAWLGAKYEF